MARYYTKIEFEYDANDNLVLIKKYYNHPAKGETIGEKISFEYDAEGNIIKIRKEIL